MKLDTLHPAITLTVHGSLSRRAKLGLRIVRIGAWLVKHGGVNVSIE